MVIVHKCGSTTSVNFLDAMSAESRMTLKALFYCALILSVQHKALGDGNVGCLFSAVLCINDVEWCYNDNAFGRCLQASAEPEDYFKYDLTKHELQVLEKEMTRLFALGFHWSNSYTQCILQALLYSMKIRTDYKPSVCENLKDQNLDAALKAIETDPNLQLDPHDMAYVKFTPSAVNPNTDFADEVYFPTVNENGEIEPVKIPVEVKLIQDEDQDSNQEPIDEASIYREMGYQPDFPYWVRKKSIPKRRSTHFNHYYNTLDKFRSGAEKKDLYPVSDKDYPSVVNDNTAEELGDNLYTKNKLYRVNEFPDETIERPSSGGFNREYNTPDKFREGIETKDRRADTAEEQETTKELLDELSREISEDQSTNKDPGLSRGYTEGGLIMLPGKQNEAENTLNELLNGFERWGGFKRLERMDVKKPGPLYLPNSYAFKANIEDKEKEDSPKPYDNMDTVSSSKLIAGGDSKVEDTDSGLNVVKKVVAPPPKKNLEDKKATEQFDFVDTNYAYIGFKSNLDEYSKGKRIVNRLATLFRVPESTFTNVRIDRNEVSFKVEPNKYGLNGSVVASKIDGIKDQLSKEFGLVVVSAGIGDQTKLPTVLSLHDSEYELYLAMFVVACVSAAVLLSAALLVGIRRYSSSKNKLQGLATADTEASKDYQDLCRARMAAKPPQDTPQATSQRIASLSRESDNSPSSRSSTSSWSEEPALSSMDISTGHMVLSYMEDHLRNKDRLETEWAALCAYEAEPCATTIAQRPENTKKNRYVNALPYDHARVCLNLLSNISGSDYINASTITDHDPRNPAYIATQGPLPHTAPDFWQMVWEQGCVVIVMLTRLIENDVAMCHRYWPEEGSELYHIYEVHLVSEHIWCDDYLVRSFYLKNLKTGETRTVTQFHFLSWPENGVPTSTKALLEFRRKVNKSFRGRSCPIVVHCSDGVGRTGTYCLLDMVLNRMSKGAKEIDIAATLEHIRDQRGNSVATKHQFQLVLAAVAEEVQAILRILPQQQPPQQPAQAQ
uniref:Receptor-type tyrosine-protein phosphatase N2 n=1 Tax=Clastoptera arizonana TaxID=38151 RepID=A0A1B6DJL1_9HEMI